MATTNQIKFIQALYEECESLGLSPAPLPQGLTALSSIQVGKILDELKALKVTSPSGRLLTSKQEDFLIILHGGADCPSEERERIRLLSKEAAFTEIALLTNKPQKASNTERVHLPQPEPIGPPAGDTELFTRHSQREAPSHDLFADIL